MIDYRGVTTSEARDTDTLVSGTRVLEAEHGALRVGAKSDLRGN